MTGFRTLLLKESLEAWRSRRVVAVVILFVVLGIVSALTARYLPEILKLALGDQLTVPLPAPTPADAVLQLQKNLGQIGALVAIVLAMGAVATEKERGTAAFVLTKPVSRGAFLGAKLVAWGRSSGWRPSPRSRRPGPTRRSFSSPGRSSAGWPCAVLAWLGLAAWAAVTFLASTVSGSAVVAAGVGVVALIAVSLVGAIPQAARFLPAGLEGPARALATTGTTGLDAGVLTTAVVGTIVLIAGSAVLAWLSFRRQEL